MGRLGKGREDMPSLVIMKGAKENVHAPIYESGHGPVALDEEWLETKI